MKKLIDFTKYSSIHIGGECEVEILQEIKPLPKEHFIIGGCNNLLISPNHKPFVKLGKNFSFMKFEDDGLHVGGATKSGQMLSYAKQHDLANFEMMQKLPGTLGGMVKMNAGLKEHEIFNHLTKIRTSCGWIEKKDIDFGYRYAKIDDIVYEAVFSVRSGFSHKRVEEFKKMRENQPQNPSCGSAFANPKGDFAGRLIEAVSLKGEKFGDMCFSPKHANFLVNLGNGTFDDALTLLKLAEKRVFEDFGIKLKREITVV